MSIDMISRAKAGSKAKGTARCILFGLADAAQNDGIAWPGRDELRQWGGCSEPTVSKALATLEALGEVVIARNRRRATGRQTSNAYYLPLWADQAAIEKTLKAQDDRTDILTLFLDRQGKPVFSRVGVNTGLVGRGKHGFSRMGKHGFTPINRNENLKIEPESPAANGAADGAPLPFVVFDPETTNGTATQRPPQTTDTSKSERPVGGSAGAAPAPKWQPFYEAVGTSLGVPWAKAGGSALAWAGNLARQFGATSAGDVAAAVALWAEFEAWARAAKYGSGHRWDFVNKATAGDHAGKFLSDRSPARVAERDAAVPPSTRWAHAFDPPPVFASDDGWGVVEVAP